MPKMVFYNKISILLESYIAHFWLIEEDLFQQNNSFLMPMDHVDLIIPIDGELVYEVDNERYSFCNAHFHGVRRKPIKLVSNSAQKVFGITFKPAGFYFISNLPMKATVDGIFSLKTYNPALSDQLELLLFQMEIYEPENLIKSIQHILEPYCCLQNTDVKNIQQLHDFSKCCEESVIYYCQNHKINIKTFERHFTKYIGLTPKAYIQIKRFEEVSRALLYKNISNLTTLGLQYDFYDQSHFNKIFKQLSNRTPKQFYQCSDLVKKDIQF